MRGFDPRISQKNNILFLLLYGLGPRMMWNIKYLIDINVSLAQTKSNLKKYILENWKPNPENHKTSTNKHM